MRAAGGDAQQWLDQAKASTKQRAALQDFKKQFFNNESVVSGNRAAGSGNEEININNAIKAVEKMNKPSKYAPEGSPTRLQQALGEDGAAQLKKALYDAQKKGISNARWSAVARKLGWGILGGLGFGSGYEFIHHLGE